MTSGGRFAALGKTFGWRKGDGSPPPVFTGAGFRREDNGWGRTPAATEGEDGRDEGWVDSRRRRPLHNRHSGTRAGIQGWKFRIEPHVYSAEYGLSSVVMQRSPAAGMTEGRAPTRDAPTGEGLRRRWAHAFARTTGGRGGWDGSAPPS